MDLQITPPFCMRTGFFVDLNVYAIREMKGGVFERHIYLSCGRR